MVFHLPWCAAFLSPFTARCWGRGLFQGICICLHACGAAMWRLQGWFLGFIFFPLQLFSPGKSLCLCLLFVLRCSNEHAGSFQQTSSTWMLEIDCVLCTKCDESEEVFIYWEIFGWVLEPFERPALGDDRRLHQFTDWAKKAVKCPLSARPHWSEWTNALKWDGLLYFHEILLLLVNENQ